MNTHNNITTAYRQMAQASYDAEQHNITESTEETIIEGKVLDDTGKQVENMNGSLVKKIADAIDKSGFMKKHLVIKGIPGEPEIRGYCYGLSHRNGDVGVSLMLQQAGQKNIEVFVDYKFAKVEIYEYDPYAKAAAARWADELENRKRFE